MRNKDPRELPDNWMVFNGELQIATALEALQMTGLSPVTQDGFAEALEKRATLPLDTSSLSATRYFAFGPDVAERKTAVISSLQLMEQNQSYPPEKRIAARGLLDIMGIE